MIDSLNEYLIFNIIFFVILICCLNRKFIKCSYVLSIPFLFYSSYISQGETYFLELLTVSFLQAVFLFFYSRPVNILTTCLLNVLCYFTLRSSGFTELYICSSISILIYFFGMLKSAGINEYKVILKQFLYIIFLQMLFVLSICIYYYSTKTLDFNIVQYIDPLSFKLFLSVFCFVMLALSSLFPFSLFDNDLYKTSKNNNILFHNFLFTPYCLIISMYFIKKLILLSNIHDFSIYLILFIMSIALISAIYANVVNNNYTFFNTLFSLPVYFIICSYFSIIDSFNIFVYLIACVIIKSVYFQISNQVYSTCKGSSLKDLSILSASSLSDKTFLYLPIFIFVLITLLLSSDIYHLNLSNNEMSFEVLRFVSIGSFCVVLYRFCKITLVEIPNLSYHNSILNLSDKILISILLIISFLSCLLPTVYNFNV